jgi:glutathione peroxidase
MLKTLSTAASTAAVFAASGVAAVLLVAAAPLASTVYDFTMTTIDGKPMPFDQYKGKVLLVVNTASFCGFTPQYEGLQKLQDTYKDQGFTVIGIPSGDFMGQEYKSNGEIKTFCESKFGIKFPLSEKSVVTGSKAIPFYRWASDVLGPDKAPKWNFHKYLIGRDGKIITAFSTKTTPMSPEVTGAVAAAIAVKG